VDFSGLLNKNWCGFKMAGVGFKARAGVHGGNRWLPVAVPQVRYCLLLSRFSGAPARFSLPYFRWYLSPTWFSDWPSRLSIPPARFFTAHPRFCRSHARLFPASLRFFATKNLNFHPPNPDCGVKNLGSAPENPAKTPDLPVFPTFSTGNAVFSRFCPFQSRFPGGWSAGEIKPTKKCSHK